MACISRRRNACRKLFTVTVGTIFEGSKIPLNKWLLGFRLMVGAKKGISAHQLHRSLGITYKSLNRPGFVGGSNS